MSVRKQTPDIMGSLMSSKTSEPQSNKDIEQENIITVKPESNTTQVKPASKKDISLESNTAIKPESNKAIRPVYKEKSTFNLSSNTLNALEDAWILLRRKLKGTQRVTKTLIVEKAVEIALDDLESKSELSELYNRIRE